MTAAKGTGMPEKDHAANDASDGADDDAARTARIRQLNDALRKSGVGGRLVATRGIAALPDAAVRKVFAAVGAFDDFNADNDPWDEHDCAVMEVDGNRIIWKIDYYDVSMAAGSPDPSDPEQTVRVLTVMLAEEY